MVNIESRYLIGNKVFLRPMQESDAPHIVSWRNDSAIKRWMFNQQEITIEGHLEWFRKPKSNRFDYIIGDILNNQPIGTVNFINVEENKAETGKMIGNKNYWGGGFAKEAFIMWLNIGFKVFNFDLIEAKTMIENVNNIGLNQKIGFKKQKYEKVKISSDKIADVLIMTISKSDFYEKNNIV